VEGTKFEVGRSNKSCGFGKSGYFSAKRSYRSWNGVSEGAHRSNVENGAKVLVTDRDPADKLKDSVARLDGLPVEFRLGEQREATRKKQETNTREIKEKN